MKISDIENRLKEEETRTSYARGVKAYAEEMLGKVEEREGDVEVPSGYAPLEGMLRCGKGSWEEASVSGEYLEEGEAIAERLGLVNVVDWKKSDMKKIQAQALKSAFMLIWAEVECENRMNETFLIRRSS